MNGKPLDTSERSATNTSLCGASKHSDLPSASVEGKSFCSVSSSSDLSDTTPTRTHLPGAWPTKIRNWTDEANISFKYTKAKTEQSVKEANKKMRKREAEKRTAEESGCNHLECTQCSESFLSEAELRKHYGSDMHLAKVRVKSESKTLGDLKIFASASDDIYYRQTRAYLADREAKAANEKIEMAKQSDSIHLDCDLFQSESKSITHHGSEENLVTVPFEHNLNQESFQSLAELCEHSDNKESPGLPAATAAATNVLGVNSWGLSNDDVPYDDFFVGEEMNDIGIGDATDVTEESRATVIATLQEEVDRLKRENNKLEEQNKKNEEEILRLKRIDEETSPKSLQNIVLYLKKNDEGYDFDDAKYYRMMSVLDRPCFSVREIVTRLISCSFKINRKCGNYGGRPHKNKRGGEEEEEKPPKRKKT